MTSRCAGNQSDLLPQSPESKAESLTEALQREKTARRRAEEALERMKRFMGSVMASVQDGITILDQDFTIIFVNPTMESWYAHALPLLGKKCYAAYQGRDLACAGCLAQRSLATGETTRRIAPKTASGGEVVGWLEIYTLPLVDVATGARKGVIEYARDITERKKAKDALQESEDRFRAITATALDAIMTMDDEGRITYWNDAAKEMFGYLKETAVGKDLHLLLSPARYHDAYQEGLRRFAAAGQGSAIGKTLELVALRKDGSEFPIELSVSAFQSQGRWHAVGIVRDSTERKKAEDALRESEERFRSTFEQAAVGMAYIGPDFRYLRVNRKLCDIVGYTEEELLCKTFLDLTHPDDRETNVSMHEDMLAGHYHTCSLEKRYLHKNGSIVWVNVTVAFLREDSAELKYCMAVVEDITERKRAEEEKLRLEAQLFQAQKMQAIGTLAGGIAHDFNNLLMGIQGRTSLMMLATGPEHPHFEHLTGIEAIVQRAAGLTRQLLGFARGGKYEVKPTDLSDLAQRSSELFGRTKKELTIIQDYAHGLWPVEVDRGQIEQVLLNLYVNAWQAMPKGGTLTLRTENVALDEACTRPFEVAAGDYVRITVTDTGVGMDEETRRRIFEPFFTTKEMGRGTGLGLASAYGIIKNHEGFIEVQSERGKGTSVAVYLPASWRSVRDETALAHAVQRGRETILLVDDEEMIIEVGERTLAQLGYHVLRAHSGKEAIATYRRHLDRIDLVILDMVMPDMGGEETFEALQTLNPQVKVLLSSGYSIEGRPSDLLAQGCNGFIQKPFTMSELSSKIRQVLKKE